MKTKIPMSERSAHDIRDKSSWPKIKMDILEKAVDDFAFNINTDLRYIGFALGFDKGFPREFEPTIKEFETLLKKYDWKCSDEDNGPSKEEMRENLKYYSIRLALKCLRFQVIQWVYENEDNPIEMTKAHVGLLSEGNI